MPYVENSGRMGREGEERRRTPFPAGGALPRTSAPDPARKCGPGAEVRIRRGSADPARKWGPGVTDASPLARGSRLGG